MGKMPKPAARKYSNDRLGRIAQERVGLWAEEALLNKSASAPDLDGWDFHLSLPRAKPLDGSSYFDDDPPRLACFVQVKGTTGSRRRIAVTLEHWQHAATMALPWFFIVVEFDAPPTPARLFVIHVDRLVVEAVRRRLREEGAAADEGAVPMLNKLTMDLAWNETHQVKCTGESLRDVLQRQAGDDLAKYASAKQSWWDDAGKSSAEYEFTLRFHRPRSEVNRQFGEWALGLVDKISADSIDLTETRWGISRTLPRVSDAKISFQKPPSMGDGEVCITSANGGERAMLDAEVFCNLRVLPYLPRREWALRFACGPLDIVLRHQPPRLQFNLNIAADSAIPLLRLGMTARAARLLGGPCVMTYRLPSLLDPKRTEYRHEINQASSALPDGERLRACESAWELARLFLVREDRLVRPLSIFENATELREYYEVQVSGDATVEVRSRGRGDPIVVDGDVVTNEPLAVDGRQVIYIHFPATELAGQVLVAAMAIEGSMMPVDDQWLIKGAPRFVRRWVVEGESFDRWRQREFPGHVDALVRDLQAEGHEIWLEPAMVMDVARARKAAIRRRRR